jgi:phosphoribosyl-AMP cyclohydrolase
MRERDDQENLTNVQCQHAQKCHNEQLKYANKNALEKTIKRNRIQKN